MNDVVLGGVLTLAGSLLTGVMTVAVQQWNEARRRAEARESRLFDHRRDAYTSVLHEVLRLLDWEANAERLSVIKPSYLDPPDALEKLWTAEAAVKMFGSRVVREACDRLCHTMADYFFPQAGDPKLTYDHAAQVLDDFRDVVRKDLGVD